MSEAQQAPKNALLWGNIAHLLKLGSRRIAFVAYSNSASTVAARIAGYREALFVAGLRTEPNLVQRLKGDDESEVREVMETLRPEAIVGANDRTAGHLMHGIPAE